MAEFHEVHIVLAEGKEYARGSLLGQLDLAGNSPEAEERLDAVGKALDHELMAIVHGECVFRLLPGDTFGQVVVTAIEEPHDDQHVATIKARVSKQAVDKALGRVIASLKG
jgi:hypothetical protein